jgi:hypothetical protein
MDPNISSILQTLALIAANSSAAQIESAKFQEIMAASSKERERREIKEIEKKEDSVKKSGWEKLDESIKSLILTASTDGVEIPDSPTDEFTKMVQAKTGPVIRLRLHQKYPSLMMNVDIGLCTALSRGLILSMPGTHTINNLSPFFTPPDGCEDLSSEKLLKIDIQARVGNGLDEKDVKSLTRQRKTIPKNAVDLGQQIQNFSKIIAEIFGTKSYIYIQNTELFEEVQRNRRPIHDLFTSLQEAFGFSFLHRVHISNQTYLQSCTRGDINSVDFEAIRFHHMMREIKMGTFQVSHLYSTTKRKHQDPEGESDDESEKGSNGRNRNGEKKKKNLGSLAKNDFLIQGCSLNPNEKFGDVFRPSIKKSYKGEVPKLDGGELCHRFHSVGICHTNCTFKETHKKLPQNVAESWRKFCNFCRDEKKRRDVKGE